MKPKNYSRFFAILKQLGIPSHERDSIVWQYTDGKTARLSELSLWDYNRICIALEAKSDNVRELRQSRSSVLRQMQKMGVDTTNWGRVDALCVDARLVGKVFARLSVPELKNLLVKLRAIQRKGGFTQNATNPPEEMVIYRVSTTDN